MSQRGGAVQSNLRISSSEIASDLIPLGKADIILSVEPMESLRYLPWLTETGWLVTNTSPMINIPDYPDLEELEQEISALPRHIAIDADTLASEAGSKKASNMVMLGAATSFIDIPFSGFEKGIEQIFMRKGEETVKMNLDALRAGKKVAEDILQ